MADRLYGSAGVAIVLPIAPSFCRWPLHAAGARPGRSRRSSRSTAWSTRRPPSLDQATISARARGWVSIPGSHHRRRQGAEGLGRKFGRGSWCRSTRIRSTSSGKINPSTAGACRDPPDRLCRRTGQGQAGAAVRRSRKDGATHAVLTDPSSIAWAFNIRGGDVPHTPLALGFAILAADGLHQLFMDQRKLSIAPSAYLTQLAEPPSPADLNRDRGACRRPARK